MEGMFAVETLPYWRFPAGTNVLDTVFAPCTQTGADKIPIAGIRFEYLTSHERLLNTAKE
jgi:hypothetical protein